MTIHHNRYLQAGLAAVLAGMLLLCTACGQQDSVPQETPQETPDIEQPQPESPQPQPPQSGSPENAEIDVSQENPEETFSFADVANLEFYFSSGAGAWRTVLYIHEDGSFDGEYLDSDMGDMGEAYPNGTRYYNAFAGRFTEPERVNDYTYRMQVAELTHAHPFGEELVDGFRWVYSEAYGIHGAEDVYLYLPGAPLAELPEAYRGWVGYYDLTQTEEIELPFYGLYNEAEQNGFSSSLLPAPADLLRAEIEGAEIVAAEAEQALQEAMTQTDMNLAAGELYRIWDDTLNIAWRFLKQELDTDTMQKLTAEQLDWIAEKEAAGAAAGAAYEGGSMQSMAVNLEAAELTKQRVYILAEYLG